MVMSNTNDGSGEFVWHPDEALRAASRLQHFIDHCELADFEALVARADTDPGWFWQRVMEFLEIDFETEPNLFLDLSGGLPWAKWCVGGRMNATMSLLDKHLGTATMEQDAIIHESEDGSIRRWRYVDLYQTTCRLTNVLRGEGFGPGDTIGIYMPTLPEVVAAYFAVVRIGAAAVPLFSGFGPEAIATRLNDAGASAVLSADVTHRRGRRIEMKAIMDRALTDVAGVRRHIVLNTEGGRPGWQADRDLDWQDACDKNDAEAEATIVASEHPLLLVYTSGTTGRPKGATLTHCGNLAKICFDINICMDLSARDRAMWISDFGWIIGPNLATSCAYAGATLVMTEGTPDYPDAGRLWRLISEHNVTFAGVSPTIVRGMMRLGVSEVEKWDLSALRVIASSGEPWTDEAWNWLFEHVCARRVPILNWTGGTEVGGGILIGNLLLPLKPCAFSGPAPGMGAEIFDVAGEPVGPGELGELVMTAPSIGQSRGLWRDPERYIETYWSMYPNAWRQGDWASRDADGMWYLHGRSDDTLKLAGKRTGPAEIEGLIMATGVVSEAAAIGIPDERAGQSLICVCVAVSGEILDDRLRMRVGDAVADGLGRAFRPARVLFVSDLPKTRNMKIMRRVVRAAVLGEEPGDLTALVNPEVVDELHNVHG